MSADPHTIQALTAVFLRWLARVFPPPPLHEATSLSEEELRAKYKWTDRLGNFVVIPCCIAAAAIVLYALFEFLTKLRHGVLGDVAYMLHAVHAGELVIWAIFIAFFSGPLLGVYLVRLYLGRDFKEYLAYGSHYCVRTVDHGRPTAIPVNVLAGYWVLCLSVSVPLLIVVLLRIDTFTGFTDTAMLDNDFLSLRTVTRPYSEITGIYDIQGYHGRFEDFMEPYQIIRFRDGTVWNSEKHTGGERLANQREAMAFVARKCGLAVQVVNFEEDIPAEK
ncbi:hypothetical protein AYO44_01595 [Planctomycetaceae bacterium SCGC AG-212-F19]|nr:hypothetical protein AYO44_01595 [Planctomycetaceae bacterium SCGC AG-212-F19]